MASELRAFLGTCWEQLQLSLGAGRGAELPLKDRNPFKKLVFEQRISSVLFFDTGPCYVCLGWSQIYYVSNFDLTASVFTGMCRNYRHVPQLQASVTMPEYGSVSSGVEASLSWISFGFTWWMLSANQVSCPPALP